MIIRGCFELPFSDKDSMTKSEMVRYNLYDVCWDDLEYRLEDCEAGDVIGEIPLKYANDEDFIDYLLDYILETQPDIVEATVRYRNPRDIEVDYELDIDIDEVYAEYIENEKE